NDIVEISAWVKIAGDGLVAINATTRRGDGSLIAWSQGSRQITGTHPWQKISTRLLITPETAHIRPRLTGYKTATVWIEGYSARVVGNIANLRAGDLPDSISTHNDHLKVSLDTHSGALTVTDTTNHTWQQSPPPGNSLFVKDAAAIDEVLSEKDRVINVTM